MLALSDPHKTRPYQPKHCPPALPVPGLALHSSGLEPSPGAPRRVGSGSRVPMHERSHSDTPSSLPPPVDLSAESSSVTSLSNLQPLRKTLTSGKLINLDTHVKWFEARCCQSSFDIHCIHTHTYIQNIYTLQCQVFFCVSIHVA